LCSSLELKRPAEAGRFDVATVANTTGEALLIPKPIVPRARDTGYMRLRTAG
jgi:hypothetical protein